MTPRIIATGIPTPSPTFAPMDNPPVDGIDTAEAVALLVEEEVWVELVEEEVWVELVEDEVWMGLVEKVLVLEVLLEAAVLIEEEVWMELVKEILVLKVLLAEALLISRGAILK
jgi:hypothetical protein